MNRLREGRASRVGATRDAFGRKFAYRAIVAIALATVPTLAGAQAPLASARPSSAPETPSARFRALLQNADDASLARNPMAALFRGSDHYLDQFGDYLSDAHVETELRAATRELAALHAIDRSLLPPEEQIAYDVFAWQHEMRRRSWSNDIVNLTIVRPLEHFNGIHIFYPDANSGDGPAPFNTVQDYENGLLRMAGFARYLDATIPRMRQGIARGIVQPRLVMTKVAEQLDALIAQGVDASPFFRPTTHFPAVISAADRARLTAAYRAELEQDVVPAFTRLRDFIRADYLAHARESIGLSAMPGGARLYAFLVQQHTTTSMTPNQIHALGLAEVARIQTEMERVKSEIGFHGTLRELFDFVRTDQRFQPQSAEALIEGYRQIGRRVDQALPRLFATVPRTPLEVRPLPQYLGPSQSGASYRRGSPDGTRPGLFMVNTYALSTRPTITMETLYLHEGVPGHHYQQSLAQEQASLPSLLRFESNTAFNEGWALYAESLGDELGLFQDPYQRFGHLIDEMVRALRLVVDTGIHTRGWSRNRAIEYMLEHSSKGRPDIEAEVDRYIANPGQALAYKIGQLTITRLRERAQRALGSRFDIRRFHDQVLNTGALPMTVLEAKIDRWIAASRR
jgi:uncharacterized protein (DUF885 family)